MISFLDHMGVVPPSLSQRTLRTGMEYNSRCLSRFACSFSFAGRPMTWHTHFFLLSYLSKTMIWRPRAVFPIKNKKTHSICLKEWVHLSITLVGTFPHPQKAFGLAICSLGYLAFLVILLMDYVAQDIKIVAILEPVVKSNRTYKQCSYLFTHKTLLYFSHHLAE